MMIQSIRTQNVLWTKVGDFKAPSSTAQPIAGLEGFTISRFWHCNLLRMGRVNWIGLSLSGFLCKVPKRTVITAVFSQVSTVLSQSFWNTEAISAWTLASLATKDWNKLVGRMMRATKFKTLMMKSRSCGTDLEVTISHNKHLANFFLWEHLQSKFSHPESHTLGSIYLVSEVFQSHNYDVYTNVSVPEHAFQTLLFLRLDEVGVRSRLILALFSIFVAFLPLALHLGLMCSESGDWREQRTFWAWIWLFCFESGSIRILQSFWPQPMK